MNFRKILFIASIFASLAAIAADNASQTLDKCANKLRTAKSVTATYSLTTPQGVVAGELTLSGDKFVMTGAQMHIWYDGKTQWTYLPAENEVNISEPTAQELQQVNPFIIVNSFRNNYTSKSLPGGKNEKKIQLTAKNTKADIKSATIIINASTLFPTEISLVLSSGQTATIRISGLKTGNALPISHFRFPKSKYPKADIIDLR